jgi:low affinity Fe/Cu permease
MIELLAFIGGPKLVIIAIVFLVVVATPVAVMICFLVIYLVKNNKERRQFRTEVERLTEEVNKLKQERR